MPVEVGGTSVILIRDEEMNLRGFHNVCPHRGTKLLDEPMEGRKTIVCPYHGWIFEQDGRLVRSAHFCGVGDQRLPSTEVARTNLREVQVGEWLDFVFVNLDPQATNFDYFIAPLRERWSKYDLSEMRKSEVAHFTVNANWKLVVENFMEHYHLPFLHPALNRYAPFQTRFIVDVRRDILGIGSTNYRPVKVGGSPLARWPIISDVRSDIEAEYFVLYPSFLVGIMPDHLFVWELNPRSAGQTEESLHLYYCGDTSAFSEVSRPARQATLENWSVVNTEDISVLNRIQEGVRSPGYDRALLSIEMEANISKFQRLVLGAV